MAGKGNIGLEAEIAFQIADLLQYRFFRLGRMTTAVQQSEHQGSELMAKRQAGKTDAGRFALARNGE
ncbi:MAG: hypothetical protein BWY57_02512 [Betaproteobacteria bacterium ADurb.Bin341]|nr:MAG: hypothetical protein BWY57_02512 [Betaproteobacteria bacterium ADurb.Bin341]